MLSLTQSPTHTSHPSVGWVLLDGWEIKRTNLQKHYDNQKKKEICKKCLAHFLPA